MSGWAQPYDLIFNAIYPYCIVWEGGRDETCPHPEEAYAATRHVIKERVGNRWVDGESVEQPKKIVSKNRKPCVSKLTGICMSTMTA